MDDLTYQSGFGNEFATEAVAGALPQGRNSPQRPPLGLYAEQLSGTAFTAPRGQNRRSWLYRVRPSAAHGPLKRIDNGLIRSAPFDEVEPPANRLRWDPLPMPTCACTSPLATTVRTPSTKSSGAAGIGNGFQRSGSGGMSTPPAAPLVHSACSYGA